MSSNLTRSWSFGKLKFLRRILTSRFALADRACPYCGAVDSQLIQRKHGLLDLRRCFSCSLMFRWPKDSVQDNESFYQNDYRQGMTPEQWVGDKEALCATVDFNMSARIRLLRTLAPTGYVLDYGSSWGYGTYRMAASGYNAVGFEISRTRAELAVKHFGVRTITCAQELDEYKLAFDVIFASHVLEHLPSLNGVFERFIDLLKPGGLLLIFVPNCGGRNARSCGVRWGPMCCEEHTMAFEAEFFERNLPRQGFSVLCFSDPYSPELLNRLLAGDSSESRLDGDELVVCAWKVASSGERGLGKL
jgi:2-polyprenyl-3-methyl-5-hydroxy-6-metoxy-1,4-benzoquinol methylase